MTEKLEYGPTLEISKELHAMKYRTEGESFKEATTRFAAALADNPEHFHTLREILRAQAFMGGGRTQAAIGAPRKVTAMNCFVSEDIEDSMESIMDRAKDAAETMRVGGGIGYDFSTLRPKGDRIVSLDSKSSGPISFMNIFDAICHTISSAGHRRGAQMGVLRVDHPDIEDFIHAKQNTDTLEAFNISIGITDEFMEKVKSVQETGVDEAFNLTFEGKVYKQVSVKNLWEEIMRSTWDWAEPGVLLIDRINQMNNLWYCEDIKSTNPCGEQPLPPGGACLLGSWNLVKYIHTNEEGQRYFNFDLFKKDIPPVVRAMDNIHDITTFPLEIQKQESKNKRRMGLGLTGVANAGESLGYVYGSEDFLAWYEKVLILYRDTCYETSVNLALEKGSFPAFDAEKYCESNFIKTLPKKLQKKIKENGIRNSHLLSLAPTGTISLTADNVSGGIEPVFSHYYDRTINTFDGPKVERVTDYAYREWGVSGKTANECTAQEHLNVLALSTQYVDSAVSKTINVSPEMPWEEFKNIYVEAWKLGCKGCTTFNSGGKRYGILNSAEGEEEEPIKSEVKACFIDPTTGQKECS